MNAREEILARIARATTGSPNATEVPRSYRGPAGSGSPSLFAERLVDYKALVKRVRAEEVGREIEVSLKRRGAHRIVAPPGFAPEWLRHVSCEVVRDEPELSAQELDALDGVVTTCTVAIAETGTIVLTHGPAQGRRALSLVPDYHLVVVIERQVVFGVPDAVASLEPAQPMTWISGPSATSDIELARVEGVHGPRTLEVLLVS
ncbi:MAG: LUD domain-containing protein [Acidimicrobiales bacterium]